MSHFQTVTTICHDGQFWVALIERRIGGDLYVARHVFGPEPGNAELLAWAGQGFGRLRFLPAAGCALPEPPVNPKRRKRAAAAARQEAQPSRARDAVKAARAATAGKRKSARAAARRDEAARRHADRVARQKARRRGGKEKRPPG